MLECRSRSPFKRKNLAATLDWTTPPNSRDGDTVSPPCQHVAQQLSQQSICIWPALLKGYKFPPFTFSPPQVTGASPLQHQTWACRRPGWRAAWPTVTPSSLMDIGTCGPNGSQYRVGRQGWQYVRIQNSIKQGPQRSSKDSRNSSTVRNIFAGTVRLVWYGGAASQLAQHNPNTLFYVPTSSDGSHNALRAPVSLVSLSDRTVDHSSRGITPGSCEDMAEEDEVNVTVSGSRRGKRQQGRGVKEQKMEQGKPKHFTWINFDSESGTRPTANQKWSSSSEQRG